MIECRQDPISPTTYAPLPEDSEAAVAAVALRDALAARQAARRDRRAAQHDRSVHLSNTVQKLRRMARNSLWSAVWQGGMGLASAGCRLAGARGPEGRARTMDACSRLGEAVAKVDCFAIDSARVAAEKQAQENAAERAAHRAQDASDEIGEAQRLTGSLTNLIQKIEDSRSASRRAAAGGGL